MKLLKKFAQYAIGNAIVLLLGLISSPIITRLIKPEQMGKYSMFDTITNMLLVVLVLGLDQSFVRFYFDEEENNRGKLLQSTIRIPIIISLILCIIIFIFYKPVSNYIVGEKNFQLAIFLCAYMIISVFNRFALLQVRMAQHAKIYSILNVVQKSSYILLAVLLYYFLGNSYITLVIAITIGMLIATVIAIFLEKKTWFNIDKTGQLKTSNKSLLKFGIPLIFAMIIQWAFQSTDKIMLKQFSGYEEIGLYSGAASIVALLNAFQGAFTTFWTPVVYEHYNQAPDDKKFYIKVNEIVSFIMIILAIVLISFKNVVSLLLGPSYRNAIFIFPFLVFMPIMYTISETTSMGIGFSKKSYFNVIIASISMISNIVGNYMLIPNYGAKGAAIATGLSYILFFTLRTYFSNKCYPIKFHLFKFALSIIAVYILAFYSSFHNFNLVILFITIFVIVLVCYLYKNTLIYIKGNLTNYLQHRK